LPGKLLFSDITVDPGTGQIILRSEFPNPDLDLLPGSFVRVRLEQATVQNGITVPQRAVQRDSAGIAQVLTVDQQMRVAQQPVQLGAVQNDRWIVTGGLKPGDRIVIEGLQHARPGEKVQIDDTLFPLPRLLVSKQDALLCRSSLSTARCSPGWSPCSSCWPVRWPSRNCRWRSTRRRAATDRNLRRVPRRLGADRR
jgi:hypothetical protein